MRFGRFLNFNPMGLNPENSPTNLTERKFREYWDRTDGGTERQRFGEVAKLMREELHLMSPRRKLIGKQIIEKFADGKWHALETIATDIGEEVDHVASTLDTMKKLNTYGCTCEIRQYGTSTQHRIFPHEKPIGRKELIEKLAPIIKELRAQGRCNMSTMSPASVAILASRLQKQLDEWTE
jgi:hypothetical protein